MENRETAGKWWKIDELQGIFNYFQWISMSLKDFEGKSSDYSGRCNSKSARKLRAFTDLAAKQPLHS